MHKVVTINLNGHAYQFDEDAFDVLRAYLDRAETQLKDNPDRTEILADLEQAIADKCQRFLGTHKTVIGATEISQVLDEMGPVEGPDSGRPDGDARSDAGTTGSAASGARAKTPADDAPRRLYRIMDGSMVGGVCNGLAAYFKIDPTLVRIGFVLAGLVDMATTHAPLVTLAYFAMWFFIPEASTSEERAAASGLPFNAHELVERAKRNISSFKSQDWRHQKKEWRRQHREWKRQFRHSMRSDRFDRMWSTLPPAGYATRVTAGIMIPVLSILSLALLFFFLYALFSLVTRGGVYAWRIPTDLPIWVPILALVFAYIALSSSLHAARRASYFALGGAWYGRYAAGDGLFSMTVVIILVWLGYQYVPEVHRFIDSLPEIWNSIRASFNQS